MSLHEALRRRGALPAPPGRPRLRSGASRRALPPGKPGGPMIGVPRCSGGRRTPFMETAAVPARSPTRRRACNGRAHRSSSTRARVSGPPPGSDQASRVTC